MIVIGIANARSAVATGIMQLYCYHCYWDCYHNNDDCYIFVVIIFILFAGSCGIDGEDDSYDFGTGAGFYIDATEEKWKTNYRMFSYVTKEVIHLARKN